jgi:hypothetical protein
MSMKVAKGCWTVTSPATFIPLYFLLIADANDLQRRLRFREEIGWRGLLTPLMVSRFGFTGGAILAALIWAAWHMPLILAGLALYRNTSILAEMRIASNVPKDA